MFLNSLAVVHTVCQIILVYLIFCRGCSVVLGFDFGRACSQVHFIVAYLFPYHYHNASAKKARIFFGSLVIVGPVVKTHVISFDSNLVMSLYQCILI